MLLFGGLALSTLTACGAQRQSSSVAPSSDPSDPVTVNEPVAEGSTSSSANTNDDVAPMGSGIVIAETSGGYNHTVTLRTVDPATGTFCDFRAFSCNLEELSPKSLSGKWRKAFNSDFTYMCVQTGNSSTYGPYHVGWIDTSGVFFDVTKRVVAQQGDFGGVIKHQNPSFETEGYLYYADTENDRVLRVPISNVSEASVEKLADHYTKGVYYAASDGTISWGAVYSPDDSHACWFNHISDWVDNEHYISSGGLYCEGVPLASTKDEVHSDASGKVLHDLLPQVKGRKSYNFIVSPDGSQVAFLSYLDTDASATLFVVPVEGGEPKKISDFAFEKDVESILDWI